MPYLDAIVTENEKELTIFALNRGEEEMDLTCSLGGFGAYSVKEHIVLCDEDRYAANTILCQNRVTPKKDGNARVEDGMCRALLKPLSWNVIRLEIAE